MSYLRYVARRAAFAVLSVYLVVTATFALINLTVSFRADEVAASERAKCMGASEPWMCPTPEEIEAARHGYLAARNFDDPIHERYVGWLVDVTTLQWGHSFAYGQSVIEVIDGRVLTTLEYVLPGFVLAMVLGVAFGLFAALAKDGVLDWTVRLVAYALFGVPAFMVIVYLLYLSGGTGGDTLDKWGTSVSTPP